MAVLGKPLKIGRYDVVEVLGEGGMGAVYKAVDPRIGRTVAIKVIKGDFAQDPELRRRFDSEARAVGNLQHPNIVVVYEFGEENNSPYLVMQYLDGTPLDKIIAQRQNLPIIQKLEIIIEVLRALDYAHAHNVIHRDVKPANVHLLKDGSVKLLDFGIAREGNLGQTKTGQLMGTMWYMSPEQLNGELVDGRSDVYSAGIMLFELLTYSLPYEARDQTAVIVQRLRGDPPPLLSKYFENYPGELDEIIAHSMMRDRDERYATAGDFAFDLVRVQERLKRDMVSHFVDQARASIAKSDLAKAKELLSQVLKIDTQNPTAKQLFFEVQQSLQKVQRVERVHQLRMQAEDALSAKQLEQAATLVEQAIKIDKTDPDLLELREQIQEVRSRAQQVKKLLKLASVAQQSEEFSVAQKAVADALALDPDDTAAKVLQASIKRLLVEHEKQSRIQQLLQVARREISARQFDAARENIRKAKAIDPAHPEIHGLDQMVVAGQEQEKRRIELQHVCTEIERRLVDNNLVAARDLAGSALRKFPGEEKLVRLKTAADEAYEQQERRTYIEEHIASASRLVEEGQASSALKLLQDAEHTFPTDTRLREYLQVVRDAAAREAAEHEKKGVLLRARSALRRKSFVEAIDALERGLIQFPGDSEIRDLLDTTRQEFDRLSQKKQVEEVSRQARVLLETRAHTDAISLLERTAARVSDPDLAGLLEYARQEAANYRAGIRRTSEEATQMLDSGRHTEALRFLETKASAYGRSAEFQALLEQARRQVDEVQQAKRRILREVEEARALIRSGDLYGAEAILRACQAEAPSEPEVLALAIKIEEEKTALELRRQDEAQGAREVQQREAEAARAATADRDARTRIFREGAEPEVAPSPGETVAFSVPTSPSRDTSAKLPSLTNWPAELTPQRGEQSPTLDQPKAAAPLEVPPEPLMHFPRTDELEAERETAPAPGSGRSKKLIVIALAAVTLIAAVIVVIKLIPSPSKPAVAYLKITNPTPGAEVTVDDRLESIGSDWLIKVSPGAHSVRISADGYVTKTASRTIEAGETETIDAALAPNPPPPPSPPRTNLGTLVVQTNVDRPDVFVDNQLKPGNWSGKQLTIQVPEGPRTIQLKKPGYADSAPRKVEIAANREVRLSFKLTETKSDTKQPLPVETYLIIRSKPGALVSINGNPSGTVSSDGSLSAKVNPVPLSVQVTLQGFQPSTKNVTPSAGERKTIDMTELIPFPTKLQPAPTVTSFKATPDVIEQGGKTTLIWTTENATQVSIEPDGVNGPATGEQVVTPDKTTTYVLIAKGPAGDTTSKLRVTVQPKLEPQPVVAKTKTENPTSSTASDADAMKRTIGRYKVALESESVEQLGSVCPRMDAQAKARWEELFRNFKELKVVVEYPGEPRISGTDKAEWLCTEIIIARSKKNNDLAKWPRSPVTFALSKKDGEWHVEDCR